MIRKTSSLFLIVLIFTLSTSWSPVRIGLAFQQEKIDRWAENILEQLTLEEKIAQLLMIRVHSNYDDKLLQEIEEQIREYQPGGYLFFQRDTRKTGRFNK
ncbi:hypothetical protein LJC37_04380 [Bacteroidales bacterium OttesenSCG-928-E04]|nr:hypothetical protein [Bacteroidales bacterium OttesenSCG-928-E04]